jgi:Asp-tRNA(Asn)/Glu-tRNA(Gln) amidotransferase A subunit family amidase
MSTEHVVSRSVRDSAAILDLTHGPDLGAPYFATPPAQPFLDAMTAPGPALRIALVTRTPAGEAVDPECERAARETARVLEGLGHRVEEASLSSVEHGFGPAFRIIIAANVRAAIEFHAAKTGRQPGPDDLEKVTWAMFEAGARASAADYARSIVAVHRTGRQLAGLFQTFDLVLSPTLPRPPQKIGVFSMMADDLDAYGRDVGYFTSFTSIVNIAGNPAASLPLHWTPGGLPVGVQVIGRYGDEATVLRVSAQLEQARPWFDRRAPLQA